MLSVGGRCDRLEGDVIGWRAMLEGDVIGSSFTYEGGEGEGGEVGELVGAQVEALQSGVGTEHVAQRAAALVAHAVQAQVECQEGLVRPQGPRQRPPALRVHLTSTAKPLTSS
eukprot:536886-Prorocentrum_minimum.AAC.1